MSEGRTLRLKRIGIAFLALLAAAQFIPASRTNPTFDSGGSIWAIATVSPDASAILQRSCQDCHSNRTKWPWYSHVAPVSWVVANDVNVGRNHFNADEWGSYSLEGKQTKLSKICDELKSGGMPDSKYTLIHRSAKLSPQQRTVLCDWAEATRASLDKVKSAGSVNAKPKDMTHP